MNTKTLLASLITLMSLTTLAAPPVITTPVLEIQYWGYSTIAKIDNPTSINPANCANDQWIIIPSGNDNWHDEFKEALKNKSTIKVVLHETYCGFSKLYIRAMIVN